MLAQQALERDAATVEIRGGELFGLDGAGGEKKKHAQKPLHSPSIGSRAVRRRGIVKLTRTPGLAINFRPL